MAQKRGFAAMTKEQRTRIARLGGKASHKNRGKHSTLTDMASM